MKISYINSVAFFALLTLVACSGKDKKETKETKEEKAPIVTVETVSDRPVDQIGEYTATVEPDLITNISSAAPNRIKAIY
ncbi:MAG: efflux transporter periplasmic adaptor subunit, partial [Muribaculaceae bacterium]|nr:efflux transporter periplasmic adaptor subunit [Muribaculaceae bacterium]